MYLSPLLSNTFIIFSILVFKSFVDTLLLYSSNVYDVLVPAISLPFESKIDPLAALSVVSLVNLVSEVALYSSPFTICKLNNWHM